jgi:hypothetical protein
MKLVIVTSVDEYHNEVLNLFKKANIESFSETDIDGYKSSNGFIFSQNWFGNKKSGNESNMFFSFTELDKIDTLLELIKKFNKILETNNPIKAVVLPIEKYI